MLPQNVPKKRVCMGPVEGFPQSIYTDPGFFIYLASYYIYLASPVLG